jgi:hypothetical protein
VGRSDAGLGVLRMEEQVTGVPSSSWEATSRRVRRPCVVQACGAPDGGAGPFRRWVAVHAQAHCSWDAAADEAAPGGAGRQPADKHQEQQRRSTPCAGFRRSTSRFLPDLVLMRASHSRGAVADVEEWWPVSRWRR